MTSKISFFKLAGDEWKKLAWLTVIQGVGLGLWIPFRVLVTFVFYLGSQFEPAAGEDRLKIFCGNMGLDRWENVPVILILGVVCALCAFAYLHSASRLDLYHSLPVTRERLFGAKYLGSVMTFVTAYVVNQILGVLVGVAYGGVNLRCVWEVAVATVQGILFFLCSYSMTLLAVMLTGKMMTTFCALGVFLCYIPVGLVLRETFQDVFWITNMIERGSRKELLAYSSPWAFCLLWREGEERVGGTGLTGSFPTIGGICQLVAMAALISLLALTLYRFRKTEAAGTAIAFKKIEGILKILLAVPASLVAAAVPFGGAGTALWEGVFLVVFGILACAIMEFIYRGDIRQSLAHKHHMVLTVVIGAVLYFSLRYDWIGYNTYLPKQEDLQAMAVVEEWSGIGYEIDDTGVNYGGSRLVLDHMETTNVAALYGVAEDGVAHVRESGNAGALVIGPYPVRNVCVKYVLKNGKEVYRRYSVSEDVLDGLNEALQDQELRRKYYPVLSWQPEDITGIYYNDWNGLLQELLGDDDDEAEVKIPESQQGALLLAYQKDISHLSLKEIWEAGEDGSIDFEKRIPVRDNRSDKFSYPLSEKFTETMKLLREIVEEQRSF